MFQNPGTDEIINIIKRKILMSFINELVTPQGLEPWTY